MSAVPQQLLVRVTRHVVTFGAADSQSRVHFLRNVLSHKASRVRRRWSLRRYACMRSPTPNTSGNSPAVRRMRLQPYRGLLSRDQRVDGPGHRQRE